MTLWAQWSLLLGDIMYRLQSVCNIRVEGLTCSCSTISWKKKLHISEVRYYLIMQRTRHCPPSDENNPASCYPWSHSESTLTTFWQPQTASNIRCNLNSKAQTAPNRAPQWPLTMKWRTEKKHNLLKAMAARHQKLEQLDVWHTYSRGRKT